MTCCFNWAGERLRTLSRAACFGLALAVSILLTGDAAVSDQPRVAAERCGLAIVLAADISASVNDHEFRLQMKGFAGALRHPEFAHGLAATNAGIAVTLMLWSSTDQQTQVVKWTLVQDKATTEALARKIEQVARPRTEVGTGTAVGAAMLSAAKLLANAPHNCWRKVIDVSGDGRSNVGPAPDLARDAIVAQGITINGLAIVSDEPDLDAWYREHVIGGDAAFVIVAANHESFDVAIRKKLLRELLFRVSRR